MQTLLGCLHRPNCAQRRCALLASKLKQNHSLPSVIQRWGRAEKLHSISQSPSHILSGAAAEANPAFQGSVFQPHSFFHCFLSFFGTMQVPNTNVWHKNKVILYHLSRRTGFTNYLDFFFFLLVPAGLILAKKTILSM